MTTTAIEEFVRRHQLSLKARDELRMLIAGSAGHTLADPGATRSVEAAPSTASIERSASGDRYLDAGLLGRGGMGEVRRVDDQHLNRQVAMKILRAELRGFPESQRRFSRERFIIGQLQHPGIVPLYEAGTLDDGSPFYTMPELGQTTLGDLIAAVHGADAEQDTLWSRHRLLGVFESVCETLAFAHSRGVLHRDLKPANIMVGAFGQVIVLDWGLARLLGSDGEERAEVSPSHSMASQTREGAISGTVHYMPPEQARGELGRLSPRSDVYALGAILYAILSGNPPHFDMDEDERLALLMNDPPACVPSCPVEFEGLVDLCHQTMQPDPQDRPGDAGALAQEVRAWLEGARNRDLAREMVRDADTLLDQAGAMGRRALQEREEAASLLQGFMPWDKEGEKAPGWSLEDHAEQLEVEARVMHARYEQRLHGALVHCADLPEAHVALARYYQQRHRQLELRAQTKEMAGMAAHIETHLQALAPSRPERHALQAYLAGDGALTLHTDPPGATVFIAREERVNRRLVPGEEARLGTTPLERIRLPMGTYRLRLEMPGRASVCYPVHIDRERFWSGIAPGETHSRPVYLPRADELGPGECYVPAGWCITGGDDLVDLPLPRRPMWVEGFVIQRDPVGNGAYITFLNALRSRGASIQHLLPYAGSVGGQDGAGIYAIAADGTVCIPSGNLAVEVQPEHPTRWVNWACAMAYAQWLAARTGLPWQLPRELWWEKAARGVDGRYLPWGNHYDMSWRHCRLSQPEPHPVPLTPGAFPTDTSPYGVRSLVGGVREWMVDVYSADGIRTGDDESIQGTQFRNVRGGAFNHAPRRSRGASRNGCSVDLRDDSTGMRLARPLPVKVQA
jgi:eukaryotic-like serine/threonine-protein kinase